MSDDNQNAQSIRYPFMYKLSIFLTDFSFYLIVIGLVATVVSASELIDKSYVDFSLFLMIVGVHLLCSTKTLVHVAINPREYFTPIENREKKKIVKDREILQSKFSLFVVLAIFAQSYRGGIDYYLYTLVVMILIDIFCVTIHMFYGSGTRKMTIY